jgi:hypothetical protein
MKHVVVWQHIDTVGLEYAEIEPEPLRLEGDVVLIENGVKCAVSYVVECDDTATTRAS